MAEQIVGQKKQQTVKQFKNPKIQNPTSLHIGWRRRKLKGGEEGGKGCWVTGEITNCQVGARTEISRIFYRQLTTEGGFMLSWNFQEEIQKKIRRKSKKIWKKSNILPFMFNENWYNSPINIIHTFCQVLVLSCSSSIFTTPPEFFFLQISFLKNTFRKYSFRKYIFRQYMYRFQKILFLKTHFRKVLFQKILCQKIHFLEIRTYAGNMKTDQTLLSQEWNLKTPSPQVEMRNFLSRWHFLFGECQDDSPSFLVFRNSSYLFDDIVDGDEDVVNVIW